MRKETTEQAAEENLPKETSENQSDSPAVDRIDTGWDNRKTATGGRSGGALRAMLALPEPDRTDALEKAANSGMTVNLRSKTGKEVRWRYGEHVLVVPSTPKPFAIAHAIHLLFCAPELLEEVEG